MSFYFRTQLFLFRLLDDWLTLLRDFRLNFPFCKHWLDLCWHKSKLRRLEHYLAILFCLPAIVVRRFVLLWLLFKEGVADLNLLSRVEYTLANWLPLQTYFRVKAVGFAPGSLRYKLFAGFDVLACWIQQTWLLVQLNLTYTNIGFQFADWLQNLIWCNWGSPFTFLIAFKNVSCWRVRPIVFVPRINVAVFFLILWSLKSWIVGFYYQGKNLC